MHCYQQILGIHMVVELLISLCRQNRVNLKGLILWFIKEPFNVKDTLGTSVILIIIWLLL